MQKVKFLLIRFSSIGDIVLTTPVIRCLKKQVEGADIHFLTKKNLSCVLDNNPYIDKIHLFDDDFKSLKKELKEEDFHYVIDLHNNLRSLLLKNSLKALAFSFKKLNIEKFLKVSLKIDRLPRNHIVDRNLATTALFDVDNDGKGLDYFLTEKDSLDSTAILLPDKYVAFAIGAQHATKRLPTEMIIALCKMMNCQIILLGGKEDIETGNRISKEALNCINACGKLSLGQSANVVKKSDLVITHDTGLMHIAAAFKKDIFSVWGNTIKEFGMSPYGAGNHSKVFEVDGLKCRPCSKLGKKKCPKGHFKCMRNIDIAAIASEANLLLGV